MCVLVAFDMRWEAQWTLLLFGSVAVLYWVVQLNTRPSTILSFAREAADIVPAIASQSSQIQGGIFQVKSQTKCSRAALHGALSAENLTASFELSAISCCLTRSSTQLALL